MSKTDRANEIINSRPVITLISLVLLASISTGLLETLRLIAHLVVWMGIY